MQELEKNGKILKLIKSRRESYLEYVRRKVEDFRTFLEYSLSGNI